MFWLFLCLAVLAVRPSIKLLCFIANGLDSLIAGAGSFVAANKELASFKSLRQTEVEARLAARLRDQQALQPHLDDLKLLQLQSLPARSDLEKARKRAMLWAHPDRGGSNDKVHAVECAYARISRALGT